MTSGSTVSYVYDAAGNVTSDGVHTYQYDSENRIVSVDNGTTASYAYDNQNRRYKKTVGSTVTHYVWERSQVLAEHNGSTGAVLIDYVYSGGRMLAKIAGGTTNYFLSDRLSVRLVLDSSGNTVGRQSHLPFGEDFGESGAQEKHHFTSYERDGETSTDYAVSRQHSPTAGRFLSPDSYRNSSQPANPQSWNRYSYVENDSINKIDPVGLLDFGLNEQCVPVIDSEGRPIVSPWTGQPVMACAYTMVNKRSRPGPREPRPAPWKKMLQNFLNKHKGCRDFFQGYNDNGKFKPSVSIPNFGSWLEHVASIAEFIDVRNNPAGKLTVGELGFVDPGSPFANVRVRDWLGPGAPPSGGQPVQALTQLPNWLAFIGDNFAALPASSKELIVTHEVLHMAFGFDDAVLHTKLGIDVAPGSDPSEAISAWLAADCPKDFHYPPPK